MLLEAAMGIQVFSGLLVLLDQPEDWIGASGCQRGC
jgi:hypothetical protein